MEQVQIWFSVENAQITVIQNWQISSECSDTIPNRRRPSRSRRTLLLRPSISKKIKTRTCRVFGVAEVSLKGILLGFFIGDLDNRSAH